eukprot:TRINITY_DN3771_c0_g1_i1.p1 TRINITY_DN3771_c0_g1~~TRINITY_DN3771_c0_g1_i1.p1  ORF type:complete len:943 (+),score=239.09 TRINITY_DN3771_c0_g1_i1:98-2926(+)
MPNYAANANLPPLMSSHRGMTVDVPPATSTRLMNSSVADVVHQVVEEGLNSSRRKKRQVGTNSSAAGKKKLNKLSKPHNVLPKANRRDPTAPLPVVTETELNKGLFSCINRGLIPPSFDVTGAMGGEAGLQPLAAEPIDLRPHEQKFVRCEHLTADYGLAPLCNLKLDIETMLKPPPPQPLPSQPPPAEVPVEGDKPVEGKLPPPPSGHLGDTTRDETRTYTELLDMYSLHEFVIRKGQALDNTPEFQSYHRSYKSNWGSITAVITQLERLLTEYGVPLAYIDGKVVAKLAQIDMGPMAHDQLMACITNRDDVTPLLKTPGRKYQDGMDGVHNAAVKVQSIARMFLQRRRFKDLRESNFAALLIQRHWQIHQQHMVTRTQINKGLLKEETRWRRLMDSFIHDWGKIKDEKRLVIHIPSLSYTPEQCTSIPFYNCFQNAQLARIIDLIDPNVEVVYLSPFPIEQEALQYYTRLLQMAGVNDITSRLQVLVPENQGRLPEGLSLTKSVLYSQRNMKRLSSLTKGKQAYIVPGVVSKEELQLASRLRLPMIGPDPAISHHFSSKSGAKRIFELADVVTPIGAYDMFEEGELLVILSKFIAEYPEHPRWLIKIDNEFNGRGLACIDVRRLKCLEEERVAMDVAVLREKVYLELKDYIGKRVKIINQQVYPEWSSFIKAFNANGGVVEAVPSECISSPVANMYIHPDGSVQLLSVQEQVLSPQYCGMGVSFPQTTVPHAAVRDATLSVGSVCYQKKIMGYASVEYVVFSKNGQLRMWAVDLELHLTNTSLVHRLFQFATNSRAEPETGLCLSENQENLHYVYSGLIYHPYIGSLRHSVFFNRCKLKGIAFDTVERVGTVFHLVDSILRGCIGVLCIGKTEDDPVRMLSEAMEFIQQQLNSSTATDECDSNFSNAATAARSLFQKVIAQRRGQALKKGRLLSSKENSF